MLTLAHGSTSLFWLTVRSRLDRKMLLIGRRTPRTDQRRAADPRALPFKYELIFGLSSLSSGRARMSLDDAQKLKILPDVNPLIVAQSFIQPCWSPPMRRRPNPSAFTAHLFQARQSAAF